MGSPRRVPGEEHILEAAPRRCRAAAVQMLEAKRRKHQQVSIPIALFRRQRPRGAREVLGGPAAQPVEIALQMRGRRVGEEIVVVDPLCYEFIDCKGHAPGSRFLR